MIRPREATHDDVEEMVAFGQEFWHQTGYYKQGVAYDATAIALLTHHLIDTGIVLVAMDADRVVGILLMVMGPMPFNPLAICATEIVYYVAPAYRKGGLGVRILHKAEKVAKSNNVKYVSMVLLASVEPEKPAAVYKRLGYEQTETAFTKDLKSWQ